jgi:oxygen-independent coproporphyrinogen-3 oxidase
MAGLRPPPLSLYVHLPWCVRKCPYCDFNSHTAAGAPMDRYIDALLADLETEQQRAGDRPLVSLFFGGGTPSLFAPAQLARIVDAAAANCRLAGDAEITMEANPGTVECGDLAGYRAAGINRLSVGAQSFNKETLQVLGRIHGADDIGVTVRAAQAAGFDNINLDLMFALPGQDTAAAMDDIACVVDLQPQHVSWYQLTLEPNTVFYNRPPAGLPDDDAAAAIQARGHDALQAAGFQRYEVSAYARPGRESVHNLNYWLFGDYLAIGAGAHGKISTKESIRRYAKPAHPQQYMEAMERGGNAVELREIPAADRLFEFMLNALRLHGGFDELLFEQRTGLSRTVLKERGQELMRRGLLRRDSTGNWRATGLGGQFLNNLQAEFLPD